MKICLISNLFPPISRGGAEKVAKIVVDGLKSAGHDVFVISTKPWDGWASLKSKAMEENGIKVYRFYPFNIFYYLNDWKHSAICRMKWHFCDTFNFHSRLAVKKILQKEKPDAVMTHNLKGIGYLIPRLIHKLGIRHIHTLHDVQLAVPSGLIMISRRNSSALAEEFLLLRKWYEVICRRLFNSPDVVIAPSKWLLDFYSERGFFKNSKKAVLPNPVATWPPVAEKIRTSEDGKLSLLYLGQIEEHKGILFLVTVLKNLDIDFKLHIAGDGSKIGEVKKMVADDKRFIVHGKLPSEKIAEIFSEVDFTIVPSLCYENSPTVIYESLSFGVPVLAAKIGGVAELVHDGKNGFTFEAGNTEDLTRVLKHAAANRDNVKKMRQSAQKSVEDFRIENYIKKLLLLAQ